MLRSKYAELPARRTRRTAIIPPVVVSASAKCHPRWRRCVAIVSSSDTASSFSKGAISGVHAALSLGTEQVRTLAGPGRLEDYSGFRVAYQLVGVGAPYRISFLLLHHQCGSDILHTPTHAG